MLAIYPLLNNGEICNFTENDNKHVVEVAKLGLGYYLWLASMATMFACLIKQYLKNKKQTVKSNMFNCLLNDNLLLEVIGNITIS